MAAQPGSCAVKCPACPHPGINLPNNWKDEASEFQFLYRIIVAMDANFKLKLRNKDLGDRPLGDGIAYMINDTLQNWWQETMPEANEVCLFLFHYTTTLTASQKEE